MKRLLFLPLALCFLLLAACGDHEPYVLGELIEVAPGADGHPVSFVLRTSDGEEVGVFWAKDTVFSSYEENAAFPAPGEAWLDVRTDPVPRPLTTADGSRIPAYVARVIYVHELLSGETAPLPDGQQALIWRDSGSRVYRLENHQALVWEGFPSGPENVQVAGQESFYDLSPQAQERVAAFYEEQGLLYDIQDVLARAYAAYREQGEAFLAFAAGQEVAPVASNARVMYFQTTVTLSVDSGDVVTKDERGAAFDRRTGRRFSLWELFACPEEQARAALLRQVVRGQEEPLRSAMAQAFRPESVVFFPTRLSVCFPAGTLPGEEKEYNVSVDYSDLDGVLQPWAVPAPEPGGDLEIDLDPLPTG